MQLPGADEPHSVPTGYFKVVADSTGRVAAQAVFHLGRSNVTSRNGSATSLPTIVGHRSESADLLALSRLARPSEPIDPPALGSRSAEIAACAHADHRPCNPTAAFQSPSTREPATPRLPCAAHALAIHPTASPVSALHDMC